LVNPGRKKDEQDGRPANGVRQIYRNLIVMKKERTLWGKGKEKEKRSSSGQRKSIVVARISHRPALKTLCTTPNHKPSFDLCAAYGGAHDEAARWRNDSETEERALAGFPTAKPAEFWSVETKKGKEKGNSNKHGYRGKKKGSVLRQKKNHPKSHRGLEEPEKA